MKTRPATLLVVVCGMLVGCSGSAPRASAAGCPMPATQTAEYRVSPGDALQVFVWRNPELTANVPVRPDGKISTPLVDDMQAAGKTPTELATDIEAVLGEFVRTPEVNIIVSAQGPANQIRVIGEVIAPQAIPHREGIHMLDALVAVGGLSQFANGNRSKVIRTIDGRSTECAVRLDDLIRGDVSQDIALYPGDAVVIPEARF